MFGVDQMLYNKILSRIYDTSFFLTEYFNRDIVSKFFAPNFENTEFMSSCFYEVLQNISPIPKFLSPLFYCEQDASTPFSSFLMKNSAKSFYSIDSLDSFIDRIKLGRDDLFKQTVNTLFKDYHSSTPRSLADTGYIEAINELPLSSEFKLQVALLFGNFDFAMDELVTHIRMIYREIDKLHNKYDNDTASAYEKVRSGSISQYIEYFDLKPDQIKKAEISVSLLDQYVMYHAGDRFRSFLLLGAKHEENFSDKYSSVDASADMFIITCGSDIRMKMIHALIINTEMTSSQIAKYIDCPATTLIRHLEVLISNNIFYVSKREGIKIYYRLNTKFLRHVKANIDDFFEKMLASNEQ